MTEGDILLLDENYQVYSSIIRSLNNLRLRRGYYILPTKTLKIAILRRGTEKNMTDLLTLRVCSFIFKTKELFCFYFFASLLKS